MGTRIVQTLVGLAAAVLPAAIAAEEPASRGNLLAQAPWLKFEVVGGRLAAVSQRCNQSQHEAEIAPADGCRQKLAIGAASGFLTVHYLEENSQRLLSLHLNAQGQLTIRRQLAEAAAAGNVEFVQSSTKTTLQIGGTPPRQFAADDLWQLLLTEQDACRQHLLPLLAELPLLAHLERQLGETETALLARASDGDLLDRERWQACVQKLASSSFIERQAADSELRAGGQGVLAFLRQLEAAQPSGQQLSGEQRSRVRAMLRELPSGNPDTPALVAQWLEADKRVWRALMSRGELAQRIAAAEHLSKLCGRPVVFDPAASRESQHAQLAELAVVLTEK